MDLEELSIHVMERLQGVTFSTSSALVQLRSSAFASFHDIEMFLGPLSNITELESGILLQTIKNFILKHSNKSFLLKGKAITDKIAVPSTLQLAMTGNPLQKYLMIIPLMNNLEIVGFLCLFRNSRFNDFTYFGIIQPMLQVLANEYSSMDSDCRSMSIAEVI